MDLSDIPVVDHHAHNIALDAVIRRTPYAAPFTEALAPETVARYAPDLLAYRRSLRDLGELFGVEPEEEALLGVRERLGLEDTTRRCFERPAWKRCSSMTASWRDSSSRSPGTSAS